LGVSERQGVSASVKVVRAVAAVMVLGLIVAMCVEHRATAQFFARLAWFVARLI
jgi:hypothetical protein